jgi:ribose/xylose/arabinose/galactoside ABC-type transport system permease subunit
MVSASYVPLLALLTARVLGADTKTAATVALAVAIALLLVQGWVGGKASQLRGLRLLVVTLIGERSGS